MIILQSGDGPDGWGLFGSFEQALKSICVYDYGENSYMGSIYSTQSAAETTSQNSESSPACFSSVSLRLPYGGGAWLENMKGDVRSNRHKEGLKIFLSIIIMFRNNKSHSIPTGSLHIFHQIAWNVTRRTSSVLHRESHPSVF